MHILYLVQYFNLPDEPGGGRAYHFARHWVRAGHRVTVVTGTLNHKTATIPEKYRGKAYVREDLEGIELLRCASTGQVRRSIAGRIRNFFSWAALACWAVLARIDRPDVVYASSTPLTVGIPGVLASLRWRRPFVFEVRDLWPESAIVAGILTHRTAIALARALERFLYRRASRVVAVTRGIQKGVVAAGVPEGKVLFVPNGVDDMLLEQEPPPPREGPRPFRFIYVGALGRWNGNETLVEAAGLLRDDPDVEFEIVGDGDQRPELEARARESGARVRFVGALPKREAVERIRAADACVVCTWDHPFHRMVLANKIFDYLAAGKPVVAAADGEMAELLRESGAGVAVAPGDARAMAEALASLARTPADLRSRMGGSGRAHVIRHYLRRDLADRVQNALGEVRGPSA